MNRKMYEAYCRTYQTVMKAATGVLDWTEPELIKGSGAVKKLPEKIK